MYYLYIFMYIFYICIKYIQYFVYLGICMHGTSDSVWYEEMTEDRKDEGVFSKTDEQETS